MHHPSDLQFSVNRTRTPQASNSRIDLRPPAAAPAAQLLILGPPLFAPQHARRRTIVESMIRIFGVRSHQHPFESARPDALDAPPAERRTRLFQSQTPLEGHARKTSAHDPRAHLPPRHPYRAPVDPFDRGRPMMSIIHYHAASLRTENDPSHPRLPTPKQSSVVLSGQIGIPKVHTT